MAALSPTPANVFFVSGTTQWGTAGATITAGDLVYESSSTFLLAKGDSATTDDVFGVALNNASTGQPLNVQTKGQITIGATVAIGIIYVLDHTTAGIIIPSADLVANDSDYLTIIGPAITAGIIDIALKTTGIKVAT